jgi:transcriptional regulator with XRE-family HTH domain
MSTRGERIRQALIARGVRKQQALAAELNVHESAITRWKENAAISLDNAIALSTVLDISLDWLLLGRGTIDSHKTGVSSVGGAGSSDLARIAARIGPKSISLLISAIDSIADDLAPPARR